jgi:hypothetical protein
MSSRRKAALLAMATFTAVPAVQAADLTGSSVTIEGFGGWQNLNINAPATSIAGAVNGSEGTAIVGGDLLFKAGLFGIGVALDKTVSGTVKPWDGSIMAGLVFDLLPSFRIEGLGEVGRRGRDFGDMFNSSGQTFLGLRPGVSFRLLPSPIRFGATGLVRWPTSGGSFGSPDYGILGRVGFEFP